VITGVSIEPGQSGDNNMLRSEDPTPLGEESYASSVQSCCFWVFGFAG